MKYLKKVICSLLFVSCFCSINQVNAMQGYNYNGDDSSGRFKLSGEYLYWKVTQEQMQFAAVLPGGVQQIIDIANSSTLVFNENLSLHDPKFEWKSGFRVGIGYELPCSDWDLQLTWTRLHEKVKSTVFDQTAGIIPIALPASSVLGFINVDPSLFGFADRATSKWKFEFDTIDLLVGRNFCLCETALIHPFVGVKGVSIRQKQHINYEGFTFNNENNFVSNSKKNDFRGAGLTLGTDAIWEFVPQWNLSSGVSGALICGKFDVNVHPEVLIEPLDISVKFHANKKHRIRPMVDAYIGLDWDACLCEAWVVNLGVAYEVQYWWNQWQAPVALVSTLIGSPTPQGDLMMHGLTVYASVSF